MVLWQSVDPRTGAVVAYSPSDQVEIEKSFRASKPQHQLRLGSGTFVIHFANMSQVNSTGGSRQVQRLDDASASEAPAPPPAPVAVPPLTPAIAAACLAAVAKMDLLTVGAEKDIGNMDAFVALDDVPEYKAVLQVYDVMFHELGRPECIAQFGGSAQSASMLLRTAEGGDVPNYFANVSGESIYHRKVLSLMGLRNLVRAGCDIFNELKMAQFSGDPSQYRGRCGLGKMRALTGNTVDLDTVVLNCEQQLKMMNAVRARSVPPLPPFHSPNDMAQSADTHAYVRDAAEPLLKAFAADLKLSKHQVRERCVHIELPSDAMHVAHSNGDRGQRPTWLYANAGVLTFHVNVPNMVDVYGALLKAPYHAAKAYVLLHEQKHSAAPGWPAAVVEFFDDCISDSCFNGKWKSIEMYLEKTEAVGSIDNVLDQLQRQFQTIFTAAFFDADPTREKERAEMARLVQTHRSQGKDANGTRRAVTAADVDAWIKKSS